MALWFMPRGEHSRPKPKPRPQTQGQGLTFLAGGGSKRKSTPPPIGIWYHTCREIFPYWNVRRYVCWRCKMQKHINVLTLFGVHLFPKTSLFLYMPIWFMLGHWLNVTQLFGHLIGLLYRALKLLNECRDVWQKNLPGLRKLSCGCGNITPLEFTQFGVKAFNYWFGVVLENIIWYCRDANWEFFELSACTSTTGHWIV